ncbi:hypothetical protein QQ045_005787 [Rhodiola kirilowii]
MERVKKAMLAKVAWKFLLNESIWANFCREKYLYTKKNSPTWKEIFPLIKRLKRESHWAIGRGDIPMSLFCDWLDYRPLKAVGKWTLKEVIHDASKREKFLELYPTVVRGILPHIQLNNFPEKLL